MKHEARLTLYKLLQHAIGQCTRLRNDLSNNEFELVLLIQRVLREHELAGVNSRHKR